MQAHWHDVMERIFWVSSANVWWPIEWCWMTLERGVVYKINRTGPRTEPWGTPWETGAGSDFELLMETVWVVLVTYEENHWNAVPWPCILKPSSRRRSKLLWPVSSNAVEQWVNVTTDLFPLSKENRKREVVHNFQKGCFSSVSWHVGRLERT